MEWIQSHAVLVNALAALLFTIVSTIIAQTKTETDNKVWQIVRGFFEQCGWLSKEGKFSLPFLQGPVTDKVVGK